MIAITDDAELFKRVEEIFLRAPFIGQLGIRLEAAGAGWCRTSLKISPDQLQQHGYVHAGVLATLADHTCGGAARSVSRPGHDVITVEYKVNFLRPGRGTEFKARGTVLQSGRSICVAEAEVFSIRSHEEVLILKCISTLAVIEEGSRC